MYACMHISKCVCVCVCMCVYVYVCMYVCMCICMHPLNIINCYIDVEHNILLEKNISVSVTGIDLKPTAHQVSTNTTGLWLFFIAGILQPILTTTYSILLNGTFR